MQLISWNIARQEEPWQLLATDERIDVALLQEATAPPAELGLDVVAGDEWRLAGTQTLPWIRGGVEAPAFVPVSPSTPRWVVALVHLHRPCRGLPIALG